MQHKSILLCVMLIVCALIVSAAVLQARAQSTSTHAVSKPRQPQSVIGDGTPGSCTEASFSAPAFYPTGDNLPPPCPQKTPVS